MEEPPAPAAPMEEPPLNTWSGPYAGVTLGYGFAGDTEDETFGNDDRHRRFPAAAASPATTTRPATSWPAPKPISATAGVRGRQCRHRLRSPASKARCAPASAMSSPRTSCSTPRRAARPRTSKSRRPAVSDSNTMLGWTAGAGADIMVTEQVFGRVEYRYTDFGSDTFNTGRGVARGRATRTTASPSASA